MIIWIVIGLILAVIAFFYMKMEHQFRLVKVTVLSAVVLLLVISMIVVLRSGEMDLSSPSGVVGAVYLYIGWLGEFSFDLWDIGQDVTGRIVKAVNVSNSDFAGS